MLATIPNKLQLKHPFPKRVVITVDMVKQFHRVRISLKDIENTVLTKNQANNETRKTRLP